MYSFGTLQPDSVACKSRQPDSVACKSGLIHLLILWPWQITSPVSLSFFILKTVIKLVPDLLSWYETYKG